MVAGRYSERETTLPRSKKLGCFQSIENMATQPMSLRTDWIVEIVVKISVQPDLFHDAHRILICRRAPGKDFFEFQFLKSKLKNASGTLRCVTVPPMFLRQAPPDFKTRSKVGFELGR